MEDLRQSFGVYEEAHLIFLNYQGLLSAGFFIIREFVAIFISLLLCYAWHYDLHDILAHRSYSLGVYEEAHLIFLNYQGLLSAGFFIIREFVAIFIPLELI